MAGLPSATSRFVRSDFLKSEGMDSFPPIASRAVLGHIAPEMKGTDKSLKGKLLLDGGALEGSFFHHTVVLICEHSAEGAFGLVLNRSSGSKVGAVVDVDLPEPFQEAPLFLGGPVQPTALSFLHVDSFLPAPDVFPQVSLSHSIEDLMEMGGFISASMKVKMFAGYAGWSAGQLEMEIKRKSWLTYPGSLELVFETPPDLLWRKILKTKGGWKNKLLAQTPEDVSLN